MRPIDEMMRDAWKAESARADYMLISRAELRQLKDYELVIGTENPDVAMFRPGSAVLVDGVRVYAPVELQLHVRETLP